MTETQQLLDRLGWSHYFAAERLGVSRAVVRAAATGRNSRDNPTEAPAWMLERLRRVVAAVERELLAA